MINEPNQSETTDPWRLIEAADLLLQAERERPVGQRSASIEVCHVVARGTRRHGFTLHELVEAMDFLIRCGLIQPAPDARSA